MISKFKTSEEREKEAARTKKIFGILVALILLFSIIAYSFLSFMEEDEGEKYNGFNFIRKAEGWQTKVGDFFILTEFHPEEVEGVQSTGIIENEEFNNIIYFIAKTDAEKRAADEMSKNTLALKKYSACLPEDAATAECANTTIKSCNDATYIQKIVVFREKEGIQANETSIAYEKNCLRIEGNNDIELVRAADKSIFMISGIIREQSR